MMKSMNLRRFLLGIVLFAVIVLGSLPTIFGFGCFWRETVGMPCPTCGMSRSLEHLIHGRFTDAFTMHPLAFLLPFILLYFLVVIIRTFHRYRQTSGSSYFDLLGSSVWPRRIAIGTLVLTFALYAVRLPFYFPDMDPLSWNDKALLPAFLRLLGELARR